MKNFFSTVALVLLVLFCTHAQTNKKIILEKPEAIDFGKLPLKSKTEKVVRFRNNSDQSLVITGVVSSCGCTKVTYNKKPISKGVIDSLIVRFDAKDAGAFYKRITLTTNLPNEKFIVDIKGVVTEK